MPQAPEVAAVLTDCSELLDDEGDELSMQRGSIEVSKDSRDLISL